CALSVTKLKKKPSISSWHVRSCFRYGLLILWVFVILPILILTSVFDPMSVALAAQVFVGEVQTRRNLKPIWMPPSTGFCKMNIDAGSCSDGLVSWGLVIRNHGAEVMFAACKKSDLVALPVVAEALGLRWGLQTIMDLNLSHVLVELDASQVINCLKGELSLASIDPFILDCKQLLTNLVDVSVSFIKRCCNEAAHQLAQGAKTVGSCTWVGNSPNLQVWSLFSAVIFS
ncbi:isoflavone-7-O-methyltransferase, partial [Trifolium medium]|nr:isoflavone-7-O-methyltransferase [Trifolium medium]